MFNLDQSLPLKFDFIHIFEDFMAQEDIFKSSMQPRLTIAINKKNLSKALREHLAV